MKQVWDYTLPVNGGVQDMVMPAGAEMLCTSWNHISGLRIFALVDTRQQVTERRRFIAVQERQDIPVDSRYLCTAELNNDAHIAHVFEVKS